MTYEPPPRKLCAGWVFTVTSGLLSYTTVAAHVVERKRMPHLRTAAQQALEALEREIDTRRCKVSTLRAMNALRAALAEPVQESVKLPTTATEAELMAKAGLMWLEQNAPDRLLKPVQEPVACECSDPMCACRGGPCAECEEGEREKEIEDLRSSLYFYQRRCEALQSWQSKMRDPERTIVCDILANGKTLDPAFAGDRYTAPPQRKPLTEEEIDSIWDSEKAFADIYAIARAIERAHGIV